MSLTIHADFESSCDAQDAVRELRDLGIAHDRISLCAHTLEEAKSPAPAHSRATVVFATGLGAILGCATGFCLSPLAVWLVDNPNAYALTPLVAGVIGGVVGLIFGVMSGVEQYHPARRTVHLSVQTEARRAMIVHDLLRRWHGASVLAVENTLEENRSAPLGLAEREVRENRAVEIGESALPNLEQETLAHAGR